jgi:formate dehydrogenase major subunit
MIFWGMGVSQHTHGTDNVRGLIALAGLTGNFGKRGTGLHPLRGQNNVQGASDAGLIPMMYPNYQPVSDTTSRSFFETLWGSQLDPKPGLTVVEIMHAILDPQTTHERIRGLYVMGENPAMSDPNLNHSRLALASLEHLVVQDIFMTETALLADVVLPSSAWPEKTGTVTNTDRTVQLGHNAIPCPGEARPDLWIIQQIASGIGLRWSYSAGQHGVESVFDEMTSAMGDDYRGITWDRLETQGAVTYPCRSVKEEGQEVVFIDQFPTESGRLKLVPTAYRGPSVETSRDFPLRLITGRILEHWHTGTMTRRSLTLDTLSPEPIIAVSSTDAEIHEIHNGDFVTLKSPQGALAARAEISEMVCEGTVFLPFAFNEAAANLLTSDELDPKGKIPEFKHTPVLLTTQAGR